MTGTELADIDDNTRLRRSLTDVIIGVFRLNGALLVCGDALVADLGLTSARWQVLGAIALSPVPLPVAAPRPQHGADPASRAAVGG